MCMPSPDCALDPTKRLAVQPLIGSFAGEYQISVKTRQKRDGRSRRNQDQQRDDVGCVPKQKAGKRTKVGLRLRHAHNLHVCQRLRTKLEIRGSQHQPKQWLYKQSLPVQSRKLRNIDSSFCQYSFQPPSNDDRISPRIDCKCGNA
jgi:hypothetical protein